MEHATVSPPCSPGVVPSVYLCHLAATSGTLPLPTREMSPAPERLCEQQSCTPEIPVPSVVHDDFLKKTYEGGADEIPLPSLTSEVPVRILHYNLLNVCDPKQHHLAVLAQHDDSIFKEAWLNIRTTSSAYKVKYATIDNTTYLKSVDAYPSYEFETIFDFKHGCVDFVKDKVVVVRLTSS